MNATIGELEIGLGLLGVVAAAAWLARHLKIPYTILLVVAGLGLGWIPGLSRVGLPPQIFLKFLLPALLYPAALFMPWREFRANIRIIALLALGLVLFTMGGVAGVAYALFPELTLGSAFILGAIVAPTDPLAATLVAQRLKAPRRVQHILEGEGLVNDSTALVGYRIAVAAVVSGSFSWGLVGLEFLRMTGGGIAFGLVVGWLMAGIQGFIDDPPVEITISLLTPFVAYLPAERLGLSGVLAVVSAGLFIGWRAPYIHNAQMRLQAAPVWEMIQFSLNGLVFLLIGLEVPKIIHGISGTSAATLAWEAAVMSVVVVAIRMIWVFPAAYLPRLWRHPGEGRRSLPDSRHVALVGWTGLRGAVSLAAALGLPQATDAGAPFPGRVQILFLTYAVILATLVVQGLTLRPVIRWLGLSGSSETEEEEYRARRKAIEAVLTHLDQLSDHDYVAEVRDRLRREYDERLQDLEASARAEGRKPEPPGASYRRLKGEALGVERRTLLELRDEHVINDDVLRRVQRELDMAESRLRP